MSPLERNTNSSAGSYSSGWGRAPSCGGHARPEPELWSPAPGGGGSDKSPFLGITLSAFCKVKTESDRVRGKLGGGVSQTNQDWP